MKHAYAVFEICETSTPATLRPWEPWPAASFSSNHMSVVSDTDTLQSGCTQRYITNKLKG